MVEVIVEGESIGTLGLPFTIGRDPDCDVIVTDSSVSRRHVKVSQSDGGLFVEDVGSSNGTWIDGRRISREVLGYGHPMIVGRMAVTVKTVDATSPSAPQPESSRPLQVQGGTKRNPSGRHSPRLFRSFLKCAGNADVECPGCGRRLRCAATTKRVKCRTCESVIRFEGDTPSSNGLKVRIQLPAPHQLPNLRSTCARANSSQTTAASGGLPGPTVESPSGPPKSVRVIPPVPLFRLSTFWCTKSRAIWSFLRRHLDFAALIGMVASGNRATAVMMLGGFIHLSALQVGLTCGAGTGMAAVRGATRT